MNNNMLIEMLRALKLDGMAESFSDMMKLPVQKHPSLEIAVSRMIEAENCYRNKARTEKLLKGAKLRYTAYMQDVECSIARNLTEAMLEQIADCSFIRRGENLLITGLTGCGKSYLACAIGRQACMLGLSTIYVNLNRYMETITQARLDGTFQKWLNKMEKYDLIILDDFGLQPMTSDTRLALLQMLEDRYDKKSVIIASQLQLKSWYSYIENEILGDAIMDRLINGSSIHLDLQGESMRGRRRQK